MSTKGRRVTLRYAFMDGVVVEAARMPTAKVDNFLHGRVTSAEDKKRDLMKVHDATASASPSLHLHII